MKTQLFCLLLLITMQWACNNSPSTESSKKTSTIDAKPTCTLDGMTFRIEPYDGDKPQTPEIMTFVNGKVEASECIKWGFGSTTYTCMENNGTYSFNFTMTSEQEGKMAWEGAINGSAIEGKYVWLKPGQGDITYSFVGTKQ